jgi:hypothetical protein
MLYDHTLLQILTTNFVYSFISLYPIEYNFIDNLIYNFIDNR